MAHPHALAVDTLVERVKRHPKYYLAGGDVHFLVENYLFRVHRYFFERESAWFREKLAIAAPPGQSPKGSSDAHPFPLEDVQAQDFSRLLWVFYNPKYSIYDATVDDWSTILKLSYDWRFPEVKKLCCRELEKFTIAPLQKIELYQTYELDRKLLIPSYIAMCRRPEPLTIKEGRQLGLETALLLATARETSRGTPTNGVLSPSTVSVEDGDMSFIIKEIFGITDGPPSPSLTPREPAGLISPRRISIGPTPTVAAAGSAVNNAFSTAASSTVAPSEANGNASATTVAPAPPSKETVKSPGIGAGATGASVASGKSDTPNSAGAKDAKAEGTGTNSVGNTTTANPLTGTTSGDGVKGAGATSGTAQDGDGKGKKGEREGGKGDDKKGEGEVRPGTPLDDKKNSKNGSNAGSRRSGR